MPASDQPNWDLERLQKWMHAVLTHPAGVAEGLDSAEARRQLDVGAGGVEQVVTRSRALSGVERLEIYSTAYYARLLEVLREEFPVLSYALGEELFNSFAVGYLQRYPSRSYTLGHLGAAFPRHLAESRPPKECDADGPDWADFLIDLAVLERTFNEIFDGPGVEGQSLLDAERLASVPAERWPGARLIPVPCLQLLALRFPVADYLTAVRRGESPDMPEPASTFLAVTRRRYVVRHFALSRTEHAVLSALVAGQTLEKAVEAATREPDADLERLADRLREWFTTWAANGFFSAAEFEVTA